MTDHDPQTPFVCPDCGQAILRTAQELLHASEVTCEHCGHTVTLDRRKPKPEE